MSDAVLPPNVLSERRLPENAGSRQVVKRLDALEAEHAEAIEQLRKEFAKELEHHVSYKVLIPAIVSVAVGVVVGVTTLTTTTRSQIADHQRDIEARLDVIQERSERSFEKLEAKVDRVLELAGDRKATP